MTGKQKRFLRGLGHALNPVVGVGTAGMSEAVVRKAKVELEAHELVKVRVQPGCELGAREVGPLLAEASGSELVQVIGHTLLLYRRRKEDPTIVLPEG